jgi:diguanylate cyclase (GGDEF)-like protein
MGNPRTNRPNRHAAICGILRGAAKARREGEALSLVLIDLDDFKSVNERGGHEAGDRVLRNVGAILSRIVRAGELSARIGGDEFAVVVVGPLAQAEATAQRVRAGLTDAGISASAAAGELEPREQLRDLYRRVDFLLKTKKDARRTMRRSLTPLREYLPNFASDSRNEQSVPPARKFADPMTTTVTKPEQQS